jgi:hypothetical protein
MGVEVCHNMNMIARTGKGENILSLYYFRGVPLNTILCLDLWQK